MTTAAAVIIGNEILTAKFADRNTPWLARRCRLIGVDLVRVAVIPDVIEVIADEVDRASRTADWVFTTGGVGPTHDDMTMAGIAAAFDVPLVRHPKLEQMLVQGLGARANPAALRMADVPEGAVLWEEGNMRFPQVVMRNVCVFPGVPELLQQKFRAIEHRLGGVPLHTRAVVTSAAESDIAELLGDAELRYPAVSIGSYPQFRTKPYTVKITLDSRDQVQLDACLAVVVEGLGAQLLDPGSGEQ